MWHVCVERRREIRTVLSQENLKERNHLEDRDVEGMLALNWILKRQHVQGLGKIVGLFFMKVINSRVWWNAWSYHDQLCVGLWWGIAVVCRGVPRVQRCATWRYSDCGNMCDGRCKQTFCHVCSNSYVVVWRLAVRWPLKVAYRFSFRKSRNEPTKSCGLYWAVIRVTKLKVGDCYHLISTVATTHSYIGGINICLFFVVFCDKILWCVSRAIQEWNGGFVCVCVVRPDRPSAVG